MRTAILLAAGVGLAAMVGGCTSTPTPQPSPSPPSPTETEVVLSGDGVAGQPFGTAVSTVEPALTGPLGSPAVTESTGCPMNPKWTRMLRWQGLTVTFEAATATRTDQTELTMWQLRPDEGVPAGVTLSDDLPLTPTFSELTADNPGTKVDRQLGWYLLELPEGVTYLGEDASRPTTIWGGPLQWCE